jgi:hypothetical protein
MQFTTSTSKLAAALLDPVRGVIERGLAGSALALGGPLGPRFGEDEGEEQGEGESPALRAVRPDREFWPAAGRIPPSAGDGVIASTRRDDGAASGDGIRQPAGATDRSLAGYASAGRSDTPFVAMRASADIWHPYAGAKLDRISATADSSEVLHPYTGAMPASADSSHVYRAHTGAALRRCAGDRRFIACVSRTYGRRARRYAGNRRFIARASHTYGRRARRVARDRRFLARASPTYGRYPRDGPRTRRERSTRAPGGCLGAGRPGARRRGLRRSP